MVMEEAAETSICDEEHVVGDDREASGSKPCTVSVIEEKIITVERIVEV